MTGTRILAIDPGNKQSGYCLMDGYKPVQFGKTDNGALLSMICDTGRLQFCPDAVVIERVASYGMAVGAEVFDTCIWIGRYWEASREHLRAEVDFVYRMEEKMILCRDSRAKDANIRQALIDRFAKHSKTGKGTKDNPDWFYGFARDAWMAYAVGMVYLDKRKEKDSERQI